MATKTRIAGTALKVINRIVPGEENDELNLRRFGRLIQMLRNERIAWLAVEEYGKAEIISEARERTAEAARKRREQGAKGEVV